MDTEKTLIKALRLRKEYELGANTIVALKDVSFKIAESRFCILYGPSGSGKTTLLNLIGLVDTPTDGEVFLEKIDMAKLGRVDKTQFRLDNIGFIFQKYYLLEELTAIENVFLPAVARDGFSQQAQKKAEYLLDLVVLKKRLHHKPRHLSEGEKQRVAVARSLINDPKILLCDEPTASLDSDSGKVILDLLKKINVERGVTIFLVTHDERQLSYADDVIHLRDGAIIKEG